MPGLADLQSFLNQCHIYWGEKMLSAGKVT